MTTIIERAERGMNARTPYHVLAQREMEKRRSPLV